MRLMCVLVVCAAAAATGCESAAPDREPDPRRAQAVLSGPWPFRPTSMRLHPLSRLTTGAEGAHVVEARLELRDEDGQVTRGIGKVRLTLRLNGSNVVVQAWDFNLFDLTTNREAFDSVTRTYRFEVPVAADVPLDGANTIELDATFSADFESYSSVVLRQH